MSENKKDLSARQGAAPRAGGISLAQLLWVAIGVMMVAAFPTFIVVSAGMAPTLVALVSERRSGLHASRCMAIMNLAGVAPVVHMLWQHGNTVEIALTLLGDLYNWMFILASATAGLALLSVIPWLLQTVLEVRASARIKSLAAHQARLVEEWGEAVSGEADHG